MGEEGPLGWGGPLYARVLERGGVGLGSALLDLGCGGGTFARAAADRGARVTGIDVDRAAVSAAAVEVPEGEFRVGDAHDPPPGPFDVVAAVQLLAHVANPLAVLRAAAGVGATVVVTVWGREQECDVRAFGEALAPWLPPRRTPPGPPPVTDPQRLRRLAALAGLGPVVIDEVECPFRYPDADTLLRPLLVSGIGRLATARAGERTVRQAVLARLTEHRTKTGTYTLHNTFRILTAHPSSPAPRLSATNGTSVR